MAEITQPVCPVSARRDPVELQLAVRDVCTFYGEAQALKNVDLSVYSNEVVAILGSNGAGKRTLLKTLTGLLAPTSGGIVFRGEPITGLSPDHIIGKGIASVPEGRELFGTMTVWDNLLLGSYSMTNRARKQCSRAGSTWYFCSFRF